MQWSKWRHFWLLSLRILKIFRQRISLPYSSNQGTYGWPLLHIMLLNDLAFISWAAAVTGVIWHIVTEVETVRSAAWLLERISAITGRWGLKDKQFLEPVCHVHNVFCYGKNGVKKLRTVLTWVVKIIRLPQEGQWGKKPKTKISVWKFKDSSLLKMFEYLYLPISSLYHLGN